MVFNATLKQHFSLKMRKWILYYLSLGKELFALLVWLGVQAFLFFYTFQEFKRNPVFASTNALTGSGVALAKACAIVLNYNCALLVASMCQISITWLQGTFVGRAVPFDRHRDFHRIVSMTILLYSAIHTGAHYYNYTQIPTAWLALAFKTGPGITGHFIWICLVLIVGSSAFKRIRRFKYELFWYTHYLSLVLLILLAFHGTFCFVKRDFSPECPGSRTWRWLVGPCALFIVELALREWRSRRFTFVSKVIVHQSGVVEVQIKKPSLLFRPGQYVQLNCPEVSFLQWHPFTITSAPEEGFVSVHIRVVGWWTRQFCGSLGVEFDDKSCLPCGYSAPNKFPQLLLDGPYGSVSESFDRFDVAICIGAGIGQTPFSSILKSMWYSITHPNHEMRLKKIIYYGISREVEVIKEERK